MAFDLRKNIVITVLGKSAILLSNFLVVVLTAQLWGAEGRGNVAMFMADIGLLAIVSNVFTGSSVSYYLNKVAEKRLFLMALLWVSILSLFGAILFHLFEQENLSLLFFVISFVLGVYTFYNSVYIGGQRIGLYNAMTVLQPMLAIVFMLLIYWTVDDSCRAYFIGYALSTSILTIYSFMKENGKNQWESFTKEEFLQSFKFGFQTQLSDFLQFFNARLSYYFLAYYVGNASVGVFSICVSLSEAMLVVGRSISMVQYSRLLEQNTDKEEARKGTNQVLKLCFFVTLGVLVVVNCLPSRLYVWVFGTEFESVRMLLLFLSPGILLGSLADIIGHYFSAMGQLRVLVLKSVIGVFVTAVLSMIIISKWQIEGAVMVNLTANIVTSLVLFLFYRKDNFENIKLWQSK